MHLNEAYDILQLPENCSLEELTKRYYHLTETQLSRHELQNIQQAYNTIHAEIEKNTPKPNVSFSKKIKDFMYVYKTHLWLGLLVAFVIGVIGTAMITGVKNRVEEAKLPTPDIEILLFGDFYEKTNIEAIENTLEIYFPEWERVKTKLVYVPDSNDMRPSHHEQEKSSVMLATESPDVYIFDQAHYDKFIQDDAPFVPLDDIATDENEHWLSYQQNDQAKEHVYGADVSDSKLFKDTEIERHTKIAVIRQDAKNVENAKAFLLEALNK